MSVPVPSGQVPVPPVVDPLPLGDDVELDVDVGLDEEMDDDDD